MIRMKDERLKAILLPVALIISFVVLIVLALTYIAQEYSPLYECGCAYTLPVIIVLLSGTGIIVGILTYYFIAGKYSKEKKEIKSNVKSLYSLMDKDEREVIECLVSSKGKISQSYLDKYTKMDRVKIFRLLARMENKGVIRKEKNGKTNIVILDDNIYHILSEMDK